MCSGKSQQRKLKKESQGKIKPKKEVNKHDAKKIITQNV